MTTITAPRLEPARDVELVRLLHAAVCAETYAAAGLPAALLDELVDLQYRAQQADYRSRYPHAVMSVVWAGDQAVGRCWTDEDESTIRILDLAIVPDQRRRGYALFALRSVIERARRSRVAVVLTVRRENEAARVLYERVGFEVVTSSVTSATGDLPMRLSTSRLAATEERCYV